jgi:Leucine-rich repeat (LRR) protein
LYTWGCNLSSLTLPSASKLVDLRCQENNITSLSVHSSNLLELHCQNNKFTSLDIAGCTKLNILFGFNNINLPTLDISECPMSMAIVELNDCTSLSTLTMKTGQTVTDSFKIPGTTTIIRK